MEGGDGVEVGGREGVGDVERCEGETVQRYTCGLDWPSISTVFGVVATGSHSS